MTISRRTPAIAALSALAALAGCVSVEQAPVGKDVLQKGQRAVVIVYPAPTAYVGQEETKGGAAASMIPGLGLAVASASDDSALAASKDLQQYIPPSWDPVAAFQGPLLTELAKSPAKGSWVAAADAGLTPEMLRPLNAADSVVDWRHKYSTLSYTYEKPARDYSKFLNIDDALVFEVNLEYGATQGDGDVASPYVAAVARLYNADSMKLLWSDKETAADPPGAKTLYDFKRAPQDLVARWQTLMPQLAHSVAASFSNSVMGIASVPADIDTSPSSSMSFSSGTAAGLPQAQPGVAQPAQMGQPAFTQPGQPAFAQPGQAGAQPTYLQPH